MLNRIMRHTLIIAGLLILWVSTSRSAMQYLFEKRDVHKWWGTDQLDHGDLSSMSNLYLVPKFLVPRTVYHLKHPVSGTPANTALYLHGDSYTRHLDDSVFAGVCRYYYIDRNTSGRYHL